MAMLTKGMWVVVADAEKAMILQNNGDTRNPDLHQLERIEAAEVIINSDRPGRVHESTTNKRSAMETPDFDRLNAEAMVGDLMDLLSRKAAKGAFSQMVVVAPPQVLGAIRDKMPEALRPMVVAELDKTLTRHPLAKIATIVAEDLGKSG